MSSVRRRRLCSAHGSSVKGRGTGHGSGNATAMFAQVCLPPEVTAALCFLFSLLALGQERWVRSPRKPCLSGAVPSDVTRGDEMEI